MKLIRFIASQCHMGSFIPSTSWYTWYGRKITFFYWEIPNNKKDEKCEGAKASLSFRGVQGGESNYEIKYHIWSISRNKNSESYRNIKRHLHTFIALKKFML